MEFDLSLDQREAYEYISNMKPGEMVYLGGNAGTGKSTLTEFIYRHNPRIRKLAPTGIAAQNIAGCTIHSFLGIGQIPKLWHRDIIPSRLKERIEGLEYVIVDEISMVGKELFEFMVKTVKQYSDCYIRFIFIGDFCQLEPVKDEFCFNSKIWDDVYLLELTTIHRQKDPEFIDCLNNVRFNRMNEAVVRKIIKERSVKTYPDNAIFITPRRAIAQHRNDQKLKELKKPVKTSKAQIEFGKWQNNRIPETLQYAEDARVLMLVNDQAGRWVNGSLGTITEIFGNNTVTVTLDSGSIVNVLKERHVILNGDGKEILAFRQFPFQLGYAITIHKSQGMTLDRVAIDMYGHFGRGASMTYVALSRCRTREGLYLLNCGL